MPSAASNTHNPSMDGSISGELRVNPEHQRRSASDAIAAGLPALGAAPAAPAAPAAWPEVGPAA